MSSRVSRFAATRRPGVDVDEELVDLVAFEQAFSAAARYISVVGQLSDEILALI